MKNDQIGRNTLELMSGSKWYNYWIFSYIKKYLKGDILEIGCGIGNFSKLIMDCGKVTAIDIDTLSIKEAGKYKSSKCLVGYGDIEKNKYFFRKKQYDSIISLNVFEHIKDDSKALLNTYQLLKKNGHFVILVPAHLILFSDLDIELGHYRRYSVQSLRDKLVSAGFNILEIRYFNWWAVFGWFVFVKLLRVKNMPEAPVGIFDLLAKYFVFIEKYIKPPFGLSVVAICQK